MLAFQTWTTIAILLRNTKSKDMKKLQFILVLVTIKFCALGQTNTTIIQNGTYHLGNGQVIENGVLVMENGKITFVGSELKVLYKNAKVIEAKGKHIYPGLIAMNNYMGLNEIDAVRATRDYSETGLFNPNVRSVIAYNTDSKILPTASFNGILYTQAVPVGGIISGSSSLMKMQAWNWEDAAVAIDEGIHINWPSMHLSPYSGEDAEKQLKRTEESIAKIETFFSDAQQYQLAPNPDFNARMHAMKNVLNGKQTLYIHTDEAKGILHAINFFKTKFPNVKLALVGASESYMIIDFLKEYNIPIILNSIHALPQKKADDVDQPYKTPAQLVAAGIKVVLAKEGSWEARNLPFLAGTAVAYGLTKEQALQCISLNAAQVLGVDNKIGSLEVGKDASFVICEGDILDMRTNILSAAFICGEPINLENEQVKLARKYKGKYGF